MEMLKVAMATPFAIIWMFAGPITYIILIIDTWQSKSNVLIKFAINLTLDAFLAVIWPITWVIWLVSETLDIGSSLSRVLGLF